MHRLLGVAIVAMLAGVVAWNGSRFLRAKPEIRTKDLSFLPAPELARALACGQRSSAAALRWIDSFAYFQLQMERKDDSVAGGTLGGFQRLYDLLIGLDPKFEPFYHHAALTTGGLTGRDNVALGYLLRGTQELPHESAVWRHAAALLVTAYDFEKRHPLHMQSFLQAWADAETTEDGKAQVWQWQAGLAKRRLTGLEQLPYWLDQLAGTQPGSSMDDFITRIVREQLTAFALAELEALRALHRQRHGAAPARLEELVAPDLLRERYATGLPVWGPIAPELRLRSDPYGFPWILDPDGVRSVGEARARHWKRLAMLNVQLAVKERQRGRRVDGIEDVRALGLEVPEPPPGGSHRVVEGRIGIAYDEDAEPWPLREMLQGRAVPR